MSVGHKPNQLYRLCRSCTSAGGIWFQQVAIGFSRLKCSIDFDFHLISCIFIVLSRALNQLPLVNVIKLSEDDSNYKIALPHTNFVQYTVGCTLVEAYGTVLHTEPTGRHLVGPACCI